MAITENVPPSGSVVSAQIESFLVFHGCVSTILLSIGLLAKLNYLAAQDLVDTFTPKTKKRNFIKLNLFPLLLLKTKTKKMISLTNLIGISLAWKSTSPGLTTRMVWNLCHDTLYFYFPYLPFHTLSSLSSLSLISTCLSFISVLISYLSLISMRFPLFRLLSLISYLVLD